MTTPRTERLRGAFQRRLAKWFNRRQFIIPPGRPLVSFTFDDFPRSALITAGNILKQHGVNGTYYTALGLTSQTGPTGAIFHEADLPVLLAQGHEIGCHTFHHCPAWETDPATYEASVVQNATTLLEIGPSLTLETHSYPISYPRPATKRRLSRRFRACRGGGQTFNQGVVDLNYLRSFFLEQSRDDFKAVSQVISANAKLGGWLVFSTHDVCDAPTRFGCKPSFFEKVVQESIRSGATILVMSAALDNLRSRVMP